VSLPTFHIPYNHGIPSNPDGHDVELKAFGVCIDEVITHTNIKILTIV
jgi:hypothetical protein